MLLTQPRSSTECGAPIHWPLEKQARAKVAFDVGYRRVRFGWRNYPPEHTQAQSVGYFQPIEIGERQRGTRPKKPVLGL